MKLKVYVFEEEDFKKLSEISERLQSGSADMRNEGNKLSLALKKSVITDYPSPIIDNPKDFYINLTVRVSALTEENAINKIKTEIGCLHHENIEYINTNAVIEDNDE